MAEEDTNKEPMKTSYETKANQETNTGEKEVFVGVGSAAVKSAVEQAAKNINEIQTSVEANKNLSTADLAEAAAQRILADTAIRNAPREIAKDVAISKPEISLEDESVNIGKQIARPQTSLEILQKRPSPLMEIEDQRFKTNLDQAATKISYDTNPEIKIPEAEGVPIEKPQGPLAKYENQVPSPFITKIEEPVVEPVVNGIQKSEQTPTQELNDELAKNLAARFDASSEASTNLEPKQEEKMSLEEIDDQATEKAMAGMSDEMRRNIAVGLGVAAQLTRDSFNKANAAAEQQAATQPDNVAEQAVASNNKFVTVKPVREMLEDAANRRIPKPTEPLDNEKKIAGSVGDPVVEKKPQPVSIDTTPAKESPIDFIRNAETNAEKFRREQQLKEASRTAEEEKQEQDARTAFEEKAAKEKADRDALIQKNAFVSLEASAKSNLQKQKEFAAKKEADARAQEMALRAALPSSKKFQEAVLEKDADKATRLFNEARELAAQEAKDPAAALNAARKEVAAEKVELPEATPEVVAAPTIEEKDRTTPEAAPAPTIEKEILTPWPDDSDVEEPLLAPDPSDKKEEDKKPSPDPLFDKLNEIMSEASEKAEAEKRFGELRNELVDTEDSMRAWFAGKEKDSPYKDSRLRNLYNAAFKTNKESTLSAHTRELVRQASLEQPDRGEEEISSERALYSAFEKLNKEDPRFGRAINFNDTKGMELMFQAISAKKKYEEERFNKSIDILSAKDSATGLSPEEIEEADKASQPGFDDSRLSASDRERIKKNQETLKQADINSKGEMFKELVEKEYAAQLERRAEKLGPKNAGRIRRAWEAYKSLGTVSKFGISVLGGGAIILGGSMMLGAAGVTAGGALGYMGYRTVRAFGSMLGARIGAYVGGGIDTAVGKVWDRKLVTDANVVRAEFNKQEIESTTNEGIRVEAISYLMKAQEDFAQVEATNQRLHRRKNIAKLLGGVVGGVGTAGAMYVGDGYMKGLIGIDQPGLNKTGLTETDSNKTGGANPLEKTDGSGVAKTEKALEGYSVKKGEGIWHGVKDQMRARVIDGTATAEDLGMTKSEFETFQGDLKDGNLTQPNARLLDRAVARSITAKGMMNMGIAKPGEVVTWKPGANGGDISFSSGDKATYVMGGGNRPVSGSVVGQGGVTRPLSSAEQIQQSRSSISQALGSSNEIGSQVEGVPTVEQISQNPDDWFVGLTKDQIEVANQRIASFERLTGIKLNSDAKLIAGVGLDELFKQVPQNVSLDPNVPVKLTVNGVTYDVPVALRQMRQSLPATADDLQADDINTWVRRQIGNGKINMVENTPVNKNVVPQTDVQNTNQIQTQTQTRPTTQDTATQQQSTQGGGAQQNQVNTPQTEQVPYNPQNPLNRQGLPGYVSPMPTDTYNVPADPWREGRYTNTQAPQLPRQVQEQILQRDQQMIQNQQNQQTNTQPQQ